MQKREGISESVGISDQLTFIGESPMTIAAVHVAMRFKKLTFVPVPFGHILTSAPSIFPSVLRPRKYISRLSFAYRNWAVWLAKGVLQSTFELIALAFMSQKNLRGIPRRISLYFT